MEALLFVLCVILCSGLAYHFGRQSGIAEGLKDLKMLDDHIERLRKNT
jgi:hypothetical protein